MQYRIHADGVAGYGDWGASDAAARHRPGMNVRPSNGKSHPPVLLVTTVWGTRFVDFFLNRTLPTLLTANNLPSLASRTQISYAIATTAEGRLQIEASPQFAATLRYVQPFFQILQDDHLSATSHWQIWHGLLQEATGTNRQRLAMFVIPDCIYVDGILNEIFDSFAKGADAVYYPLPQISLQDFLESSRNSGRVAPLARKECERMWIDLINPKHATMSVSSPLYNAHPEYLISARKAAIDFIELAGHPLAIRMPLNNASYTLNPLGDEVEVGMLPIGGLSCEPLLKYHEQYSHFPAVSGLARYTTFGSWTYRFREGPLSLYSRCQHAARYGGENVSPPSKRLNCLLEQIETVQKIFHVRNAVSDRACRAVQELIALLAVERTWLRRFRRHASLTVFVPDDAPGMDSLMDQILRQCPPAEVKALLLAHVLPGTIRLKRGTSFELSCQDLCSPGTIRGVVNATSDPFMPARCAWMGVVSCEAFDVAPGLRCIPFRPIRFRSAELGTVAVEEQKPEVLVSEATIQVRVPIKSRLVRAYNRANEIPVARAVAFWSRNGYRRLIGKKALPSPGELPRQAPDVRNDAIMPPRNLFGPETADLADYASANAANSVSGARAVTKSLLRRIGVPAANHTVMQRLERIERELSKDVDWEGNCRHDDPLMRFEAGIHFLLHGNRDRAIRVLRTVVEDRELERRARASPAYSQAYIRAAEIVGAELERSNRPEEALLLYQQILALRQTSPAIAVRAVKLAWRSGRLKEAAAMSNPALETDNNLSAGRAANGALNQKLKGL